VEQGWLERRRGQATRVAIRSQDNSQATDDLLAPQCQNLIEQARQLGLNLEELQAQLVQYWHQQD
jgi:GntR family transcriptional regulator